MLLLSAKHLSSIEFASYIINQLLILDKSLNSSGTDFPILAKSIWLLKTVCIWILLSSQLLIHQKCGICQWYKACLLYQLFHCCLVMIGGGVGRGGMRKPKITCVLLFPTHLKFPISLIGICFGYYFPTLEMFYPQCLYYLVSLFHLSLFNQN